MSIEKQRVKRETACQKRLCFNREIGLEEEAEVSRGDTMSRERRRQDANRGREGQKVNRKTVKTERRCQQRLCMFQGINEVSIKERGVGKGTTMHPEGGASGEANVARQNVGTRGVNGEMSVNGEERLQVKIETR